MKKYLLRAVKFFAVLSFFVPLLVFPQSFIFPFIVPKVVVFRSLLVMMLSMYGLLFFLNKEQFRPRFSFLHGAVFFYALAMFISTFTGVDWYNSFWDSHERMLGTFTFLHGVAYYFILSQCFRTKEEWKSLLSWFLGAGTLAMGVGLWQRIDPNFLLNNASWRVIGTLGNPIYVGGYGLFVAYLGYLLGVQEKIAWKKYLKFSAGFLGIVGIFLSGTRGTMIALFLSVGLMMLLYSIFFKEHKKLRMGIMSLLGFGFLLLVLLVVFRNSAVVESVPSLHRLVGSSLSAELSGPRMIAWKIAARSFLDHPFFGWGVNNFYYAFNQYYNPHILYFGSGETWFDNAHNAVMNTLSTGGAVGILAYFGIFVAGIYQAGKAFQKKHIDLHLFVVGTCFLVAHFLHNFFVFENATSVIYFFFFLAFLQSQTSSEAEMGMEKKAKDRELHFMLKYGFPVLAIFFIYLTDINVAKANMTTLQAIRSLSSGNIVASTDLYKKALAYGSPHISDIRNDFIRSGSQLVESGVRAKTLNDSTKQFFDFLYSEQKANHTFRPMDVRIHILLMQMDFLGNRIDPNAGYFADAEVVLADALQKSPKRQQLFAMSATLNLLQGKTDEAIAVSRQSLDLDPSASQSWVQLAIIYAQAGQLDKVGKILEEALAQGVVFSLEQRNSIKSMFGVDLPLPQKS